MQSRGISWGGWDRVFLEQDVVLPRPLDLVHQLVGVIAGGSRVGRRRMENRHANAETDRPAVLLGNLEEALADSGEGACPGQVGCGKQQHELVATQSCDEVGGAQARDEGGGDGLES